MQYIDDIPVWGTHEENTLEQAKLCARSADYMALMADGHLGYGVPIGGVIASENRISPTAVGFDIACGNKAVRLDIPATEVRANIARIMDDIWSTLSFGVGRKNPERNDDSPFINDAHEGWNTEARVRCVTRRMRNSAPSAAAITTSMYLQTSWIVSGSEFTSAAAVSATASQPGFSRLRARQTA
jgi:hypothetical protein